MNWQELFEIRVAHGYLLQILAAEWLYFPILKRRNHFPFRLFSGTAVYILLSVLLTNLVFRYTDGFNSFIMFLLSFGLCVFCFQNSFSELLFCCIGAQLIQNLSNNIEMLFYLPFRNSLTMPAWLCLSVCIMAAVYTVCYRIFVCRLPGMRQVSMTRAGTLGFAAVTTIFVYFMQYSFRVYRIHDLWVTRPPLILCCIFGLCVQFGILELKNKQTENQMLEHFIEQEKRQYEITRSSMDLISLKAHDLKHQIARIRRMSPADDAELKEIESVVMQYEAKADTGNRALDILLTEKLLLCGREQIEFTVMADGRALSFFTPSDLASLFGNALDNAIECERQIPEVQKRCIALQVVQKRHLVGIHIENYCPDMPRLSDGLPETTKEDARFHGFGVKSIRYIVEKYGGNLKIHGERNLFILDILLPSPRTESEVF